MYIYVCMYIGTNKLLYNLFISGKQFENAWFESIHTIRNFSLKSVISVVNQWKG